MEVSVSGSKSKSLAYLMEVSGRGHQQTYFHGSVSKRDTLGEESFTVQTNAYLIKVLKVAIIKTISWQSSVSEQDTFVHLNACWLTIISTCRQIAQLPE